MRLPVLFALLFCVRVSSAQEVAAPAGAAPTQAVAPKAAPATGRITGTVYCADTRKPARGARVMVLPVPSAYGSTGDQQQALGSAGMDGSYAVEHLAPGEYSVIAMLPGYLSAFDPFTEEQVTHSKPAELRKQLLQIGSVTVRGAATEHFDIRMERGGAISGQVFYSDGSPAMQVTINVEDAEAVPSADHGNDLAVALIRSIFSTGQIPATDDHGRFRIAGLRPGSYRVAAISEQGKINNDETDPRTGAFGVLDGQGALHFYSGDTMHKKAATTYTVRSGDEVTGITITIPVDGFHRVAGTVSAKDGRLINSASLTLTDTDDGSISFKTKANREGGFRFPNVPSGRYTLVATNARLVTPEEGMSGASAHDKPMRSTDAFADGSVAVLVKDADVLDVGVTLTEVPMPAPPQGNPGGQPEPR